MISVPGAVVRHANPLTLRSFCKQHFIYGRGAHRFHRARALRGRPRPPTESLSFYGRLILYPVADARTPRALRLSVLLALSQGLNVTGYLTERADGFVRNRDAARRPVAPSSEYRHLRRAQPTRGECERERMHGSGAYGS